MLTVSHPMQSSGTDDGLVDLPCPVRHVRLRSKPTNKSGLGGMGMVALRSSRRFSYPTSAGRAPAATLCVREAGPADAPKPRLLDRVRAAIRARHYSLRTEKAYVHWIRRYIFFHGKRHPAEMGAPEVTQFLTARDFACWSAVACA